MSRFGASVQTPACHVQECGSEAVADALLPLGDWQPVCQEHQDDAWEAGYSVRKVQVRDD